MTKEKYIRTGKIRKKMSESHKGKKLSEETKNKISNKHKGVSFSKEHKNNLSKSLKGRHINPKTEFKKGRKSWNFIDGIKKKRRIKRWNGRLILNSHYIYCKAHNILEIPKGYMIHHKDRDSLNDDINNLEIMSDKSHKEFHNYLIAKSNVEDYLK